MKKMKLLLVAVALFAIGSAFRTKNVFTCTDGMNLYYYVNGVPTPVPSQGGTCDNVGTVACQYFLDNGVYIPCPDLGTGTFIPD